MSGVANVAPIASTIPGLTATNDMAAASSQVPTPRAVNQIGLKNAGQAIPAGVTLPTPATLPHSNDAPPEGFSIDESGEWIYDPDGTFAVGNQPESPLQSANKPPQPAVPTLTPQSLSPRAANRPMRLPTVENPVSADRFNRQHQLLAPSSDAK